MLGASFFLLLLLFRSSFSWKSSLLCKFILESSCWNVKCKMLQVIKYAQDLEAPWFHVSPYSLPPCMIIVSKPFFSFFLFFFLWFSLLNDVHSLIFFHRFCNFEDRFPYRRYCNRFSSMHNTTERWDKYSVQRCISGIWKFKGENRQTSNVTQTVFHYVLKVFLKKINFFLF